MTNKHGPATSRARTADYEPVPADISQFTNISIIKRQTSGLDNNNKTKSMWQDIRQIIRFLKDHQRQLWLHIGLFFVIVLALMSSSAINILNKGHSSYLVPQCSPGGDFVFINGYNPWAIEHAFQITIGFGSLSFSQAKAIDVVWDVVVGRGGQFLVAVVCFKVFSKSLNRMLEQSSQSISYNAFRAIVFERPSLTATVRLSQDIQSVPGWRYRSSMIWMVFASIYAMGFPTITSAMTGYSSNVTPIFNKGSTLLNITDGLFHRAVYRIDGADRILGLGLESSYIVGSRGFDRNNVFADVDEEYDRCLFNGYSEGTVRADDCALAFGVSDYIKNYGTESVSNISSSLVLLYAPNSTANYTVLPPTLAITVLNTIVHSRTGLTSTTDANSTYMYTTTNDTSAYSASYIQSAGMCIAETTYQWGFSFILLFSFLIVTGVWVLGMYIMWMDAYWNSRLESARRHMGFYRGVVDIANAIWKDTLQVPGELMPNSRIKEIIRAKHNGGRIALDEIHYHDLPKSRSNVFLEFKESIPMLRHLMKPWNLTHWMRLIDIVLGNIASLAYLALNSPKNYVYNYIHGYLVAQGVLGMITAATSWLTALYVILSTVANLAWPHYQIPFSSSCSKPKKVAYWVWVIALCFTGLHGFLIGALALPPLARLSLVHMMFGTFSSLLEYVSIVSYIYPAVSLPVTIIVLLLKYV